jgi:hypothetical protein
MEGNMSRLGFVIAAILSLALVSFSIGKAPAWAVGTTMRVVAETTAKPLTAAESLMPMARHQMIVDHPDRLHEGIDDGRTDELEAARRWPGPSRSRATAAFPPARLSAS